MTHPFLSRPRLRATLAAALLVLSAAAPAQDNAPAGAAQVCGSLENHYGPFDYRKERFGKLPIVERFHFSPGVESLQRSQSSSHLGADLNYVLRVSPNHHRALVSTMRYTEKLRNSQPPGLDYSIECFFNRAVRFQPDDTVVRLLYAHFLARNGRMADATGQLRAAEAHADGNALTFYNIGLMYLEFKDYDQALAFEHKARRMGLVKPELQAALKKANRWREPAPAPEAAAPEAAAPEAAAPEASMAPAASTAAP